MPGAGQQPKANINMSVFPIASADSRYLWFLVPLGGLMLGIVILLLLSFRGARAARFELVPTGLRLTDELYSRTIPWHSLRIEEARRVSFVSDPELKPGWRHAGNSWPGYQTGWFRLRNGERALLYVTDRSNLVYLPTSAGFSVLLSPADPDLFLATLRTHRARAAAGCPRPCR